MGFLIRHSPASETVSLISVCQTLFWECFLSLYLHLQEGGAGPAVSARD